MRDQKQRLLRADRPFFTSQESLDDVKSMTSTTFARGDLSFGRYKRDRPGLGIADPNPPSPMVMAVVILRPRPAHLGWRDEVTVNIPSLGTGALCCLDLRETWRMDLSNPFDSFHAFIPISAFDDMAAEFGQPKFERLDRPTTIEHRDETMLGLATSLNPLLGRPSEATALFADYVFAAMVTHLAVTYGGLDKNAHVGRAERRGALTPLQERRVTDRLLDEIKGDPRVAELAALSGLSVSHFMRAFKRTTGVPPHRWLLVQRAKRAKELLLGTHMTISAIAVECGFADQSHLTRIFSKIYGVGPAAWRKQWRD
jgi:AraC family transcriptional regulator